MNKPTSVPPNGGGGVRQRLLRGRLLKWNEVDGYRDPDGVQPVVGPYLLWGMEQGYQRWKDRTVVEEIIDKPLPDLEQLNEAIPQSEWEPGLDGHPRPPYSHQYCVYLLDPNDDQFFTLMNSTVGMKILWELLAERWEVMRHLRGEDVIAVVNLATRLFRKGTKYRPDLKILEWRKRRGGGGDRLAGPVAPTPQLPPPSSAPSAPPAPAAQTSTPTPAPAPMPGASISPHAPPPPPRSASPPAPPPPPPARPAPSGEQKTTDGLAFLDQVKPPTLREELNDDLLFK